MMAAMLGAIVAVTLLVPDVSAVERAYQQVLRYETVERGGGGRAGRFLGRPGACRAGHEPAALEL
jgi:hypothetical protein